MTNEQARLLVESIEATACMRDLGGAPRGFSRDEDETRAVALDLLDCRAKAEALAGAVEAFRAERARFFAAPVTQASVDAVLAVEDAMYAARASYRAAKAARDGAR